MLKIDKYKKIRKSRKLSQKELAELLNKSLSVVSKWETGAREPGAADIRLIAHILNTPVSEISDLEELYIDKEHDLNDDDSLILNLNDLLSEFSTDLNEEKKSNLLKLIKRNRELRKQVSRLSIKLGRMSSTLDNLSPIVFMLKIEMVYINMQIHHFLSILMGYMMRMIFSVIKTSIYLKIM